MQRRRFLHLCTAAAAGVPLSGLVTRRASAADAPLVGSDDPTATALHYVEDASKAKDAKPGSHCGTCALYQGAAGSAQGPCPMFPGKSVKAAGWCSAWAKKP
jgi:hypothetical protein